MDEKIAIIILAAGSSSRLKSPKQLLKFKGKTLLENSIDTALKANLGPIFVVTGSHEKEILPTLQKYTDKVVVTHNTNWDKGIGCSIQVGVNEILVHYPNIYGAIIMLLDQPLIDVSHLVNIVKSHYAFGKKIIASGYGGSFGAPAFFHKKMLGFFDKLNGDEGAKSIISRFKQDVHVIPNPEAEIDIDTEEDFQNLQKRE